MKYGADFENASDRDELTDEKWDYVQAVAEEHDDRYLLRMLRMAAKGYEAERGQVVQMYWELQS